jgi:hypothetical protein
MQRAIITKLPRGVLYLEGCGGILIILALLSANQTNGWLGISNTRTVAIIFLLVGFLLMLPAVIMLSYRTAKVMAPQLFDKSKKNRY